MDWAAEGEGQRPERAWFLYVGLSLGWLTLHAVGLLGPLSDSTFPLLGVACLAVAYRGLRHNDIQPRLPWMLMSAALLAWVVGGGLRIQLETLGDLSPDRSLVPDVFSLIGYVLLGTGLMMLHHHRYRNRRQDVDAFLDALIAALAVAAVIWLAILAPALKTDTEPIIEVLLIVYPVLTLAMASIALRFGLLGQSRSMPSHRYLVAALMFLLVGDIVYMLLELSLFDATPEVIDVPYALAFIAAGAAVFHPSIKDLTRSVDPNEHGKHTIRLVAVGMALGVPAAITALGGETSAHDRVALSTIAASLTAAATWRVIRAMRAQDAVQDRLLHAASHDSLTGLPNRANLTDYLARCREEGRDQYTGALFADLDRFKLINDGMGHATGDALLRKVAIRLRENVSPADFVARVGGDEFVVITSADDLEEIEDLAEQLRCCLGVPFRINGNEIHASLSIGVRVLGPRATSQFDTIIEDSDSALYQAKKRGRNNVVVFDHSMREWADEQLFLEQELNNALEYGQITVAYQPIVRLPDGVIEGFEALCRWDHPVMGSISPATFIPVAEETGMILDIGAWILDESCAQLARWRDDGVVGQCTMSVNLSPRQLHESSLVSEVIDTLARHDIGHGALQLEITEGLLMSDARRAKVQLSELRDAGVRISLDDFGTGYSSISQLKSFPVDSAKIDRSFVSGIGYSEPSSDESLVSAIVAMAGALGFRTIAEGVENAAQAARLFELGVRSAQGYYFSRPIPAGEVPQVLQRLRQLQPR
ncbi:MAG TPA: EAL domain-containing protein [Acidimicrobiales bacterium]|nr:EAL domain-containing protein [Acidimicrobiales bacterium]